MNRSHRMLRFLVLRLCAAVLTVLAPSSLRAYTQANLQTASDGTIETIPLEATVQQSPAQIRIKSYAAGTFTIYRKAPDSTAWGAAFATGVALGIEGVWTDSAVSVGALYEYRFVNTAGTAYGGIFPTGYILTGIAVDQTLAKGRMVVVVASDLPGSLPTEYAQYKADLIADGWTVHEVQCPRANDYLGLGNAGIATVKVNAGGTGFVNGDYVTLTNAGGKRALGKLTVVSGAVTVVAIPAGGAGAGFAVSDVLTVSGGSSVGTGANLIAHIDPTQARLASASPDANGSGYINETVTLTGQTSGKTAQCTTSTFNGKLYGFSVVSSQTGFVVGEFLTMTGNTTGTGVGPITVGGITSGQLQYAAIHASGTGYVQGDAGTLTGASSGKTAQVTLNVSGGFLTGVAIVSSQTGFTPGESLTLSGTSAGAGAPTFTGNFTGPLQSVTVNAGGSGYVNGNVVGLTYGSATAQGVLNVTAGAITSVTVNSSGTGFYEGGGLTLTGLQTTATGYNFTVLTIDNTGVGRAVSVSVGGSGYRDNDSVAIRGASSNATATGSLIATSGGITAVSVVLPGTFTVGESLVLTPTSGGSGGVAVVGASTENHLLIRSAVQAIYSSHPGEVKSVAMIGKVPVCRSGINDGAGSDGHGNEASYGADAFYADMDGIVGTDWTDTQDNISTASSINGDINLPGDKQFDQQTIFQVGNGAAELGFGRIDLSLGIQTETEAMRSYFNKLHRYKIASADFQPGRRVCDRLSYPNEREAELQSMPGVVGMSNVEFTTTTTLPTVKSGQDADQLYSTQHGPYLFYFKGSGGPVGGVGGRAVFWTGMQSHWGYWYQSSLVSSGANYMQKRLAEDSFTLSFTWNIWGLRYIYHRMGMGLDAADMMKQSINNQGAGTGSYSYKFNNTSNGDYSGALYMNHMGDPALRLFMFEPPTALSIVKSGANPALTWIASPNASVTGYHVYRATNAGAPFTRITSAPVAGTSYTDTSVSSGSYLYMVRAVRLEMTGGGTFFNASLGTTQGFNVDAAPSAVTITTPATLPNVNWKTSTSLTLAASGGLPQYAWSLASGALPAGMSLSGAGIISGVPANVGSSSFTVQATDQIAQSTTKTFTITVTSNSALVLYPEATTYTNKAAPTNSYGAEEITQISGVSTTMNEAFHRYDLSGIALNNGFVKATLFLYVTSGSGTNNYAPVQANLIADAQDGWVDNGIAKPFSGYANNGAGKVRINCTAHGFITGTLVSIAGLTGTGAPTTGPYAVTNVDADHFDLLTVAYNASWAYDPALAFATTQGMTYNTRPTGYNVNVTALNATGSDTPGTLLQFDVTSYVRETLTNDAAKKMSVRFFTQTPLTVALASQYGFGGSRPYVLFETSDAPSITVNSPLASPAYVFSGSGILLSTTVTPLPARAASLTMQWSKVSGPGAVMFTNATGAITGAGFSVIGDYTLRLTASDGIAQTTRDFIVRAINASVAGPNDSSLKLRLALDETSGTTAGDSSGNSPANNGTLVNAPTWSTPGQINGALTFATTQKVTVNDSATALLDGSQQITVSIWINPSSLPASSATYFGVITKRVAAFNKESWRIELRGSTASASPVYCTITGGTTLQSASTVTTNKWQHIVMVFDGSTATNNLQLYLNGALDKMTSITPATVPRNATANVSIGNNGTYDFLGAMDEVRIYNRALTLAEVQDLYAAVPANIGPVVSIASPISGNAGDALALSASASDDGKPGALTLNWSTLSGPGSVAFANASAASTNVTFAQAGAFGLRLTASDGAITTFADTSATISWPPGIAGWRQQYFGTTDSTGLRSDLANPANDGFSNLVKYALGLNPNLSYTSATAGLQLTVPPLGSGNGLSYTFTGTASDVTHIVEANNDLGATWTPLYTHTGSAPGTVTVQDTQPVVSGAKRFVRLRITRP